MVRVLGNIAYHCLTPSAPRVAPDPRLDSAVAPKRQVVRLGNKGAGGPFAPLVVVVRNIVGEKEFNKLRGKAISVHSQGAHQSAAQTACSNHCNAVQLLITSKAWCGALFCRAPPALAAVGPGCPVSRRCSCWLESVRAPAGAAPKIAPCPHPPAPAVIKDFCKQVGVDNKQVQAVVRLAKKNGEWLGFLA
jgi:hypothetical protein